MFLAIKVQASPTHQRPLSYMRKPGGLFFWQDHQTWLAESGYMLRPRFRTDWEPSWLKSKKYYPFCEDGKGTLHNKVMDAVYTSDDRIAVLKQVNKSYCPFEEEINRMFTMPDPLAAGRHNHVAPVYDVLQSPLDKDIIFLVMPYFMRINGVRFATIGEGIECIRQLLEGLQFLHKHDLAHCDIHINNIMMDPVPLSPNFLTLPRSVHTRVMTSNAELLNITLSISVFHCFVAHQTPHRMIHVSFGGDKTAPEYEDLDILRDPYKIDVYRLGNLFQNQFWGKSRYFDTLKPLFAEMTQHDPDVARPTIDKAFARFGRLRDSLTPWALRPRVVYKGESGIPRLYRACRHLCRTFYRT